jgi:hypothetical protein
MVSLLVGAWMHSGPASLSCSVLAASCFFRLASFVVDSWRTVDLVFRSELHCVCPRLSEAADLPNYREPLPSIYA